MADKKIPMRTCVGCHTSRPKKEMIRVVRRPDGTFAIDRTGKMNGRGAYLCPDVSCLEKARKSGGLDRSFQGHVRKDVYDALEQELKELSEAPGE